MIMANKYKSSFNRPKPKITPRKTGLDLIDDDLNQPMQMFHSNTKYIRQLINSDTEDINIYRYCIVLICATMDKYMHDIEKAVILQIFRGKAQPGKNFDSFLIPITVLNSFDKNNFNMIEKEKILSDAIYEVTSNYTIQKSTSIDRNMNYILDFNIWKAIQPRMTMRFKQLNSITQMKKYIDELVDRRNSIVHELDFRPNSNNKNDLSKDFVSNALEIIQYFIESVNYQIVRSIISSPEDINFSTGNENFDDISNT